MPASGPKSFPELLFPTVNTRELHEAYVIPTYGRFDIRLARGKGCRVWDEDGVEYLDFGAGIAVCTLGHSHPKVTEALCRQAATLVHTSNLYYHRLQGELAQRIVEKIVGVPGKVFFCNSGAEANEALYKLARKYGNDVVAPPPTHTVGELVRAANIRYEIITFEHSFHGRTMGGISATGQAKVKHGFSPLLEGFRHVRFNDAPAVLEGITAQTVAVLLEPVQGESGIWPADPHFLRTLRSICDDYGLLLMLDEVQCGFGRTGDWCAWQTLCGGDVIPDAISWAKGIAGGFAMGAIWVRDREVMLDNGAIASLADILGPGTHGSTFGGTPLACAAAEAVLSTIENEGLVQRSRELGVYAKMGVESLGSPLIKDVRGLGLMVGIEFVPDLGTRITPPDHRSPAAIVVNALHEARLLTVPSVPNSIRWLPPLNVAREEIDEAVEKLGSVLSKLNRN
jgi:acetylornithine/N-succinyldiaminopimelate aminotransferase